MWDSERWDSARVNCGDNRHWPDWFDPTTAVIDGPNRFLAIWRIIKPIGPVPIIATVDPDHTFSMLDGQDAVVSSALAVTKERGFDVVIEAVGTTH
jgi:hypothetical protein